VTYEISADTYGNPWIRCLRCGLGSYNPNDIQHKYCGYCHIFHEDFAEAAAIVNTSELLDRALEIIESAYSCPEWLRYGRTPRTDETLELIVAAVGLKLPEVKL
jgi:hypothetical protein